jgi:hypothetical protein
MSETKEQLKREILEAVRFRGTERTSPFWVYSRSVQPGSAVGYADLRTALERAYSLACVPNWGKEAVESGNNIVYVYHVELDQFCRLQKIT